ncbi:MAG: hypothetical protein AAFV53_18120 [Myxococcota bacterium]
MDHIATLRQSLTVIGAQLSSAGLIMIIDKALTGGIGLMVPLAGLFLGAVAAFCFLGSKQVGWPKRRAIQRTAVRSALVHWLVGTVIYAALFFADPSQFEFSAAALVMFAPLVGVLPGLSALILTMCAGDSAATILGSYGEEEQLAQAERRAAAEQRRLHYKHRHGQRNRAKVPGQR